MSLLITILKVNQRREVGVASGVDGLTAMYALGENGEDASDWRKRALCPQTDPEAFFPEKGGSTREAKKVCLQCDVRDACLAYALAQDERFGIWGGLSERERRRLKRQQLAGTSDPDAAEVARAERIEDRMDQAIADVLGAMCPEGEQRNELITLFQMDTTGWDRLAEILVGVYVATLELNPQKKTPNRLMQYMRGEAVGKVGAAVIAGEREAFRTYLRDTQGLLVECLEAMAAQDDEREVQAS